MEGGGVCTGSKVEQPMPPTRGHDEEEQEEDGHTPHTTLHDEKGGNKERTIYK